MSKSIRQAISILLCMIVIIAASAPIGGTAYAAKTVVTGSTVTARNINSEKPIEYSTPRTSSVTKYNYNVKGLPEKCTVYVKYKAEYAYTCSVVLKGGSQVRTAGSKKDGDYFINEYPVSGKADISLDIGFSSNMENAVAFTVTYAPAKTPVLKANTKKFVRYTRSITGYSTCKFKVVSPASGYLEIYAEDYLGAGNVTVKGPGMQTCQAATTASPLYIGVKKGTYTFTINTNVSTCVIRAKFHKVSENKYGTSKAKAALIKSSKNQKGLIITNKKKVHWYKVKVTKAQAGARLVINTNKMTFGGNGGGVKFTVLFPNGGYLEQIQVAGQKTEYIVSYGESGADMLGKGTYYIKVESYNTGSGYFTLKWD